MPFELNPLTNPLRVEANGMVWAGRTRMPFVQVIRDYQAGQSPEMMALDYPGTPLEDFYAAILYYLQNREECLTYEREDTEAAERLRQEYTARRDPNDPLYERVRKAKEERRIEHSTKPLPQPV